MSLYGNENIKIVYRAYLPQKWVDLHQTKAKMIFGPFHRYLLIYFSSRNILAVCAGTLLSIGLCEINCLYVRPQSGIVPKRRAKHLIKVRPTPVRVAVLSPLLQFSANCSRTALRISYEIAPLAMAITLHNIKQQLSTEYITQLNSTVGLLIILQVAAQRLDHKSVQIQKIQSRPVHTIRLHSTHN